MNTTPIYETNRVRIIRDPESEGGFLFQQFNTDLTGEEYWTEGRKVSKTKPGQKLLYWSLLQIEDLSNKVRKLQPPGK